MFVAQSANAQDKKPIKIGFGHVADRLPVAERQTGAARRGNLARPESTRPAACSAVRSSSSITTTRARRAEVPGIYTKLLDVDKVDLVRRRLRHQRDRAGDAGRRSARARPSSACSRSTSTTSSTTRNTSRSCRPARTPRARSPRASSRSRPRRSRSRRRWRWSFADAEFSQNACEGARENAKKGGYKIVYDKSYPPPPKTTDFTPIVRALKAANADLVVVCAYPANSVGIVQAAERNRPDAEDVRRRHGRPAGDGVQEQAQVQAQRHRELRDLGAGQEADV